MARVRMVNEPLRPTRQAAYLALGTASALGFARFAYGLLLPAMRADLGWSLSTAGMLGTANGLGYLFGAAATTAIVRRLGPAATFRISMALTALALTASAAGTNHLFLAGTRAAAGATGAAVFISGGVIASRLAARSSSGSPITVYFAGTGLGIIASGMTLPILGNNWRAAWIGLGIAAGLATLASWSAADSGGESSVSSDAGRARLHSLGPTVLAYLLFAAGYITYITFLSAYLAERDASTTQVIAVWLTVGLAVVAAPLVWRRPITHWPDHKTLAVVLAALGGGAALALMSSTPLAIVISAAGYGATFMTVPAVVTALVKNTTAPPDWTATLAACTTVFAIGQTVGPWLAGLVADHTGADATVAWTTVLCFVAAAIAATQPITPRSDKEILHGDLRSGSRRMSRRLVFRPAHRAATPARSSGITVDADRGR
ncbi:YbfB/YjiJ family MFS transporter [Nocardia paucivorans]|uniref:YbfB/YjiJ family MFS transporter n=1 Tax=Nocardia paucivorans TaxID=114259 RepID=UPI0002F015FE|nr:YbfB/YjiJ family MFS transporter [Nocardia paucivorans]